MTYASPLPGSAQARISTAICMARVMCIVGVVYAHAWTGMGGALLASMNDTPQGVLRWVLMEFFGRSAVPLLGMISGWLVADSARARSYLPFVIGKARTILLPMVLWNAIALALVCGAAAMGWLAAPVARSVWWVVDELLCLVTPGQVNVQMAFLRDLFVCMALAPLLMRLPTRWLVLAGIVAAIWTISNNRDFVLLLRPAILMFFIAGMLARRVHLETRVTNWPLLVTAIPFMAMAIVEIWMITSGTPFAWTHPRMRLAMDTVMRFSAALFFWRLAWTIAGSRLAGPMKRIEPYMFLMFCAHLVMIWFGGPFIGSFTGRLGEPLYPVFLLLQPLLVLGATLILGQALMAVSPPAARVLSGGRLKGPRWRRPAAAPAAAKVKTGALGQTASPAATAPGQADPQT